MTRYRGPYGLLLRIAVLVGGASFVIGLTGVGLLLLREEPTRIRVVVEDSPEGAHLAVQVQWVEGTTIVVQDAKPGSEPREWILPPLPRSRPVTILVHEAGTMPPRLLRREELSSAPPGDRIVLSVREPKPEPTPTDQPGDAPR